MEFKGGEGWIKVPSKIHNGGNIASKQSKAVTVEKWREITTGTERKSWIHKKQTILKLIWSLLEIKLSFFVVSDSDVNS